MRPAFSSHPIAVAALVVTMLALVVMELSRGLRRRSEATHVDLGSVWVIRLATGVGILVAGLALRVPWLNLPFVPVVFGLGLAFLWMGIALRAWSIATLGRYFTLTVQTSPDQPLITGGPYRWLRHPSYLALLVIFAGLGIVLGNPVSLVALVAGMLVGLMYRIRVEEAALRAASGPAFDAYAEGRKRLLPFIW